MASGTPVILFAPKDTAVVKYAEAYEWAMVVTKNDTAELSKAIVDLVSDQQIREKLAKKAKQVALERHDQKIVAKAFQTMIVEAAN